MKPIVSKRLAIPSFVEVFISSCPQALRLGTSKDISLVPFEEALYFCDVVGAGIGGEAVEEGGAVAGGSDAGV